jgi:hypothetical protein
LQQQAKILIKCFVFNDENLTPFLSIGQQDLYLIILTVNLEICGFRVKHDYAAMTVTSPVIRDFQHPHREPGLDTQIGYEIG